jgi:hypothetical protein
MPVLEAIVTASGGTDESFRLWTRFIHNAILSMSFVTIPTTDEIDFDTVSSPPSLNTYQGHRLYRFDDALQSTAPIYFRVDYGSAGAADRPNTRWTIGNSHVDGQVEHTGSSGETFFTGSSPGTGSAYPYVRQYVGTSGVTSLQTCSISGDGTEGWLVMALWWGTTTVDTLVGLERTKDANGNDDSRGVLVVLGGNQDTSTRRNYALIFNSHSVGTLNTDEDEPIPFTIGNNNPSQFSGTLGDIHTVSPIFHFGPDGVEQGKNFIIYQNSDFSDERELFVEIQGETHIYKTIDTNFQRELLRSWIHEWAIRYED